MKNCIIILFFFSIQQLQSQKTLETNNTWKDLKIKWSLAKDHKGTFEILHIGDSHIQPNNLSGITRLLGQTELGNAGRGLIFPYNLAKTNGPKDYTFKSSIQWRNSWITSPNESSIGLTGISITSTQSKGDLKWKTGNDSLHYPSELGFISYEFSNCQSCSINVNGVQKKYKSLSKIQDTIQFKCNSDSNTVYFEGAALTILDIVERSISTGLLYHSTGVAGATFLTYINNPYFNTELKYFNPDLVIVSLGTNESFLKWDEKVFRKNTELFVQKIETQCPKAKILIVLPNENYKFTQNKWVYNTRIDEIRKTLLEISIEHKLSTYDQQAAMGGKGCLLEWEKNKLVNKDHIHLLKKGYQKQGKLLYQFISNEMKL